MAQVNTAQPMNREWHRTSTMPVYEPAMQEHRSRPVDDDTLVRAFLHVLLDGVDDTGVTVAFVQLCAREGI